VFHSEYFRIAKFCPSLRNFPESHMERFYVNVSVFEGRFDLPCNADVKKIRSKKLLNFKFKRRIFHNFHTKRKSFFNLP
jgi:hypothetical protein